MGSREAQANFITSREFFSTTLRNIGGQWAEKVAAIENGRVEAAPQGSTDSLQVRQVKASRGAHKEPVGDLEVGCFWDGGRGVQHSINREHSPAVGDSEHYGVGGRVAQHGVCWRLQTQLILSQGKSDLKRDREIRGGRG